MRHQKRRHAELQPRVRARIDRVGPCRVLVGAHTPAILSSTLKPGAPPSETESALFSRRLRSRSRNSLWRKGDTSGAHQTVYSIGLDCDSDAVRFIVEQVGFDRVSPVIVLA